MGETQRRKVEIDRLKREYADWLETLTQTEREVALVAKRAHERIIEGRRLFGGCYLLAFFLYQYLKLEKGIETTAVVGWVNDGTTPLMISHAWIELGGKKTDIALTHTEHPDAQLSGELILLDHTIRSGKAKYTYHRERSKESMVELLKLRGVAPVVVAHKEEEHLQMEAISKSDLLIQTYLNAAPPDRNYKALTQMLA